MGVVAFVQRLRPSLSGRLAGDIIWNLASFAIMGVAGLALNFLIAWFYDAATLGAFNQTYTIYILLSQLAVAGMHLSVLKYAGSEPDAADSILSGALLGTVLIAAPVAVLGYVTGDGIGALLGSDGVGEGVRMAAPGLLFFALNKVLMALHNGRARLRAFAVFQSLRFIFMIAALLVLALRAWPGAGLPLLFTIAEAALLLGLLAYTAQHHSIFGARNVRPWLRRHLEFGSRALWGNLLADVNTRVDILLLGVFATDSVVGVYSFAALIAEGFSQLGAVFRNVVNPHLARYRAERTTADLEVRLRKGIRMTYAYAAPLGAGLMLAYPAIVWALGKPEYRAGWGAFLILMAGAVAAIGYSAFQMILNQGGYPGFQSVFFGIVFGVNVLLNVALIPLFGMQGSALATALACVVSIFALRHLAWRAMQVRM